MRSFIRRALVVAGILAGLGVVGLGLLVYADFETAGTASDDPARRLAWVIERGDRLHYAGHVLVGRVLDVCPCSRRAAAAHYSFARFHALTTTQKWVLSNTQPRSPGQIVEYFLSPVAVSLEWVGDGIAWFSGERPTRSVIVDLDGFAVTPDEIRIGRGTRVTWRNVDEVGEAHTVTHTNRQFDSGLLAPEESFTFAFTERGRYEYYCAVHGGPNGEEMTGVIIVD